MKIALLGCKGTTLDLLNNIVSRARFNIDLLVTLPEDIAEKNNVAFYRGPNIVKYCDAQSIPTHVVSSYTLTSDQDLQFFEAAAIDLLLVIGWERLVPDSVLQVLGRFACGMHGSAYGLPKGRGRSPLNWSILTNHSKFITYLFRYNPAVDAGHVIGFKAFDINQFDTIATLHAKNRIVMYQLLEMYIPLIESDEVAFWPQPPGRPTYYPKRTPDDSGIDWTQTTSQIYDLIRAVSPPYPPAYCFCNEKKLYILEAYPFDTALFHRSIQPGTIVDISISLSQFVVTTANGTLIVKQFSGADITDIAVGDVLTGVAAPDVLRQIVRRYPADIALEEKEI